VSFTTGHYLENFDQSHSAPASKTLSTFDWVSEKAAELKAQTRTALANKDNRQMAVEGVTLAAGLAASALLHINLSKSPALLKELSRVALKKRHLRQCLDNQGLSSEKLQASLNMLILTHCSCRRKMTIYFYLKLPLKAPAPMPSNHFRSPRPESLFLTVALLCPRASASEMPLKCRQISF